MKGEEYVLAVIFFWKNTMENSKGDMEERCHSAKETAHDFEEVDPNREYYRLYRKLYSESLKLKQ